MLGKLVTLAIVASTAFAHSNMFTPKPREDRSNAFLNIKNNGCENTKTQVPGENTFARGQNVPLGWWWNNHSGGFIKMALIKTNAGNIGAKDKAALLDNPNIIQGQCYTRNCNQKGFDPGNKHKCEGAPLEIPDWVSDGEYVLQWSHFGGYDSEGVKTRQLPIYHTCANIRIKGGKPLKDRPKDWIAPFFGGEKTKINGKSAGANQCAFKNFAKEPADPKVVNTKDDKKDNIRFGGPEGWAAVGKSNRKRNDAVRRSRLGHISRNALPDEVAGEGDHHDHEPHEDASPVAEPLVARVESVEDDDEELEVDNEGDPEEE